MSGGSASVAQQGSWIGNREDCLTLLLDLCKFSHQSNFEQNRPRGRSMCIGCCVVLLRQQVASG